MSSAAPSFPSASSISEFIAPPVTPRMSSTPVMVFLAIATSPILRLILADTR